MDEELLRAAERVLGEHWGAPVTCEIAERFRDNAPRRPGASHVWRLRVAGGPVASVILKASLGDESHAYRVGDDALDGPFERLVCEWAGLEMIAPHGLGPRALGGDIARGFCLIEDLGAGDALADRLLGDDPDAARAALFAYARSLGDMHAATAGAEARWSELRLALGAPEGSPSRAARDWPSESAGFTSYLQSLGVAPAGLADDLAAIGEALVRPGPYLAFTPSDCCPDNHVLRGDRVVFFDCEGACMRHALLDAAYFVAPFPTCWCCAHLPEDLPEALLAAYRERFPGGADFDAQLTLMLAVWLAGTATRFALMGWADRDLPWRVSSARQRGLELMRNFLARPGAAQLLPGFSAGVAALSAQLTQAWSGLAPMPRHPVFGGPAATHPTNVR